MIPAIIFIVFIVSAATNFVNSQSGYQMTPSVSITDGQTLRSAEDIFELGFFSPTGSINRYLGIWFRNIPQTIVWIANRDSPLNSSTGVLNLTTDGNLSIFNLTGHSVWSTRTSNAINPALQLLDSGNLVLTDEATNFTLWQSFDYPCDTALAGQKIGTDIRTNRSWYLTSWKNDFDPSPGEYSYSMETEGVPELFLWHGNTRIYRSGPWTGQGFSGRPNMGTTNVFKFKFVNNQYEAYYTYEVVDSSLLAIGTLNNTGEFERLIWSKESNAWKLYWSVPADLCDQYATCGANGICTTFYSPSCQCLQGFVPNSETDWNLRQYTGGCVRMTTLNCSTDGFIELQKIKLPNTRNASIDNNKTLDECRDSCVNDCSCIAYTVSGGSGCLTWTGDLVDIRMFTDGGDSLYVRLAASELDNVLIRSPKRKKIMIIVLTLGLGVLLISSLGILLWIRKKKKQGKRYSLNPGGSFNPRGAEGDEMELPLFDISTIKAATNNFSANNLLGRGGFGPVYKGSLEVGEEIAVKRLSKNSVQGLDEFKTEVLLISKLQHKNLVRLLGCCIDEEERILVYEYMSNKSLDAFIYDKKMAAILNWQKRFDIIRGIARGLLYLHNDSRLRIIHRDMKASNILLYKEMTPKISDFGTARIFKVDQIEENTINVVGTYGYMSPEYAMDGIFSEKSDVFSFGVLLMEVISGKRNRMVRQGESRKNLLAHAWKLWKEGRCLELLDAAMEGSYPESEVQRYIHVALLCVQEGSEDRPTMEKVVLMLGSGDVLLPQPSQPGFYKESALMEHDWSSSVPQIQLTVIEGR